MAHEPTVDTRLAVKLEGGEEMIVLDAALNEILADHGFSVDIVRTLRFKWNVRAREWAENEGTVAGHGQKIQHNSTWKNALPSNIAIPFLAPLVTDAVRNRRNMIIVRQAQLQEDQAQLQVHQAQLQEELAFDNAFLQ